MMRVRFTYLATVALALVTVCGISFSGKATAASEVPGGAVAITVSYQPAFWALPWFIATDKGWWSKVGLKPTLVSFAAGAAQVAAGASGSWDVGGAGDIPAILGAARYSLLTVAISDKEAAILSIMARNAEAAARYKADPSLIKGKTIPATLNSNGERVSVACLSRLGAVPGSYQLVDLSPAAINSAVISGRYDLAGVWAPNTYILESAIGAKVVCTGAETDLPPVTGHLFATPTYAQQHPEGVARFLALYEHGVEWERKHPKETLAYLNKFYETVGIKFPEKYLPDEVKDHRHLTLSEQLQVFRRTGSGESEVDRWSDAVAEFLNHNGSIKAVPAANSYITGRYLEMVMQDPALKKFAMSGDD